MLYLFVLAIGTDYNILMTARLREEAKEGHDPRRAAALAVEHGGPTVAAAGLILAGTCSVMLLAKVSMLQMGFSIALDRAVGLRDGDLPGAERDGAAGPQGVVAGARRRAGAGAQPRQTREDLALTGSR